MPSAWRVGNDFAMSFTALLIDTDETRARALEEKLAVSGYARVVRAEGADIAAAVEKEHPDLIIVDMALPDRDAIAANDLLLN